MKRRFTGTVLALAVAAGIYLGNKWKGPGLGGSGIGTGTTGVVEENSSSSEPDRRVRVASPETVGGPGTGGLSAPALAPPLLVIEIHGNGYLIHDTSHPLGKRTATLDEIREQVAEVPGNDVGIRVRLVNARDAQEGARSDLYAALANAGVKREEIQEKSDFVE